MSKPPDHATQASRVSVRLLSNTQIFGLICDRLVPFRASKWRRTRWRTGKRILARRERSNARFRRKCRETTREQREVRQAQFEEKRCSTPLGIGIGIGTGIGTGIGI